jgi:hypothetical protein
MEMQKSVGELTAKVDRLIDDVHGHGKDISGINTKINYFLGAAAVVTVVGTLAVSILLKLPWERAFVNERPTGLFLFDESKLKR